MNMLPDVNALSKNNTSTICQTETASRFIYKQVDLHEILVSPPHVREAATAFKIVSGFENMTILPEKIVSPNKDRNL
jgi:hypothetical protein